MNKIDTHRHAGGAIPCDFVWNTIQTTQSFQLSQSIEEVRRELTYYNDNIRNFHHFLRKFRILDQLPWTESLIVDCFRSICNQIVIEELDFAWLDVSINKYLNIGWTADEALAFVADVCDDILPNRLGLILSLKYESPKELQRKFAKLIDNPRVGDRLFGIDLVGDEDKFDPQFYSEILRPWRQADKMVRAHVGEFGPAENVVAALLELGVTNVAHGFKIANHLDILSLANDFDVVFDMGLTSNMLTGVTTIENHPLPIMLRSGLKLTFGTDDPIVCDTTLPKEYDLARKLGASTTNIEHACELAAQRTRQFL